MIYKLYVISYRSLPNVIAGQTVIFKEAFLAVLASDKWLICWRYNVCLLVS